MTDVAALKAALRRRQRRVQLRGLRNAPRPERPPDAPITVLGLFSTTSGLGEAARLLASGLEDVGRTVARIDVTGDLDPSRARPFASDTDPGVGPVIVHLNPIEAAEVMARRRGLFGPDRERIGVWLYERDRVPAAWTRYAALFHQIWSPGERAAQALRAAGLDVHHVPYRHAARGERAKATPRGASFRVLVMADYHSSLARKDVCGAVAAFQSAFADATDAELILKLSHLPDGHSLREVVDADTRIGLLEDELGRDDTQALIRNADCLLSLHRCEGYGLGLVDALMQGTPVVMSDEASTAALRVAGASFGVEGQQVPVRDAQGIYAGGTWFQADRGAAAKALRARHADWRSGEAQARRDERRQWAETRFANASRLDALRAALGDAPRARRNKGRRTPETA